MDGWRRKWNGLNGWMGEWVVKGSITRQTVTGYRDKTGQNDTMYKPYCSLWPLVTSYVLLIMMQVL